MTDSARLLRRAKYLVFFSIVWIIIVYAIGAVLEELAGSWATLLTTVSAATAAWVKWFSWKKALTSAERTLRGYFWLYLPWFVSVVLPLGSLLIWYLVSSSDEADPIGAWARLMSWLPLIIELIVPVVALSATYWLLGRLERVLVAGTGRE